MSELGEQIKSLREQGMTYSQIKTETGASKSTIAYYCGAGQKDAKNNRTVLRRNAIRAYIQEVKQASPCMDCGEDYPYWMMDFDHVRGEKEFNICHYRKTSESLQRVKDEIAKCDIVCANCHRNRTHFRLVKGGEGVMDLSNVYVDESLDIELDDEDDEEYN